ncbi:MAG: hypothetical protein U0939_06370 [Pirellulales bacterium]
MLEARRDWLRRTATWSIASWTAASIAAWPNRTAFAAEVSVELELATETGVSPTASQQWLSVLKDLPIDNLRIRSARGGELPELAKRGDRVLVTGVITSRGQLMLPGGSFGQADVGRIRSWISKVKSSGGDVPNSAAAKPFALGLTAEQLIELHEGLNVPVAIATKGASSKDVVRKIRASVRTPIEIPSAIVPAFADDPGVLDELQGVAAGTALAAVIRPLGLVLIPDASSAPVKLVMARALSGGHVWPVGWPPEKNPTEYLPALLKFLDVEITDTPLNEALEAVQGRLKAPFLFDHNGLARHRIDPATISVTVPPGKTFYSKILDRMMVQAKLKWEVRIDEAGQPLIWISTKLP